MANRVLVNKDRPSFKQQNLPAWQPILTAGTVLPTFFLVGVAFVPIGIVLLMSSLSVQEFSLDYTDCKSSFNPSQTCEDIITKSGSVDCQCNVEFELTEDFKRQVYVYYGLSNFYQNHRRYVKSRDDYQLLGNVKAIPSSDCAPFDRDPKGLAYAPCGAIANSMFNDTFDLRWNGLETVTIISEGIAWPSDKNIRYQNPPGFELNPAGAFANTSKPPNWRKPVWQLWRRPENNGFQNEALMVWMRTAALPTFRKLYGIITTVGALSKENIDYLPAGKYVVEIKYNYSVKGFNGRKRFILSNTSWLGGKNHFLSIAYIVVGCICFIMSAIFLYIHRKYGKLPSEIVQINQTTPYLAS